MSCEHVHVCVRVFVCVPTCLHCQSELRCEGLIRLALFHLWADSPALCLNCTESKTSSCSSAAVTTSPSQWTGLDSHLNLSFHPSFLSYSRLLGFVLFLIIIVAPQFFLLFVVWAKKREVNIKKIKGLNPLLVGFFNFISSDISSTQTPLQTHNHSLHPIYPLFLLIALHCVSAQLGNCQCILYVVCQVPEGLDFPPSPSGE